MYVIKSSNLILCRMLIPTTELGRFDNMVMPFELEAYHILKSRSGKQRNIYVLYNRFYFHTVFIQSDLNKMFCLHDRNESLINKVVRKGRQNKISDKNLYSSISSQHILQLCAPLAVEPLDATSSTQSQVRGLCHLLPLLLNRFLSRSHLFLLNLPAGLSPIPEKYELHKDLKPPCTKYLRFPVCLCYISAANRKDLDVLV